MRDCRRRGRLGRMLRMWAHHSVRSHTPELAARYRTHGYWTDRLLIDFFESAVSRFPNKIAIVDDRFGSITYLALQDRVWRLSVALHQRGVPEGRGNACSRIAAGCYAPQRQAIVGGGAGVAVALGLASSPPQAIDRSMTTLNIADKTHSDFLTGWPPNNQLY